MIIRAAMMINGTVQSLPRPKRHHDIIKKFPNSGSKHGEQGFIDDQLGFVSREVAKVIAVASNQIIEGEGLFSEKLFSEDLW